jgi:hypothetical protein
MQGTLPKLACSRIIVPKAILLILHVFGLQNCFSQGEKYTHAPKKEKEKKMNTSIVHYVVWSRGVPAGSYYSHTAECVNDQSYIQVCSFV